MSECGVCDPLGCCLADYHLEEWNLSKTLSPSVTAPCLTWASYRARAERKVLTSLCLFSRASLFVPGGTRPWPTCSSPSKPSSYPRTPFFTLLADARFSSAWELGHRQPFSGNAGDRPGGGHSKAAVAPIHRAKVEAMVPSKKARCCSERTICICAESRWVGVAI